MKKIFGLTIAALLIIGLVGGGTWAYFSDTETSTGNTFTAGTLDLALTDAVEDGTDGETLTYVFSGIAPEDEDWDTLTVQNNGSVDGVLDLSVITVTDDENLPNPESETTGGYDLSQLLTVHMFWDVGADGSFDAGSDTDVIGTDTTYVQLSSIPASTDIEYYIENGTETYLTLRYYWPSSANDNDAQGDETTLIFTVNLNQYIPAE